MRSLAYAVAFIAASVSTIALAGFVGFVVAYFVALIGLMAYFVRRDRLVWSVTWDGVRISHEIVKTDGVATLATHWCMTHDCPATRRECLS